MAAEGGTKKIFISHAAEDLHWPDLAVEALAEKLRKQGAEVWLDLWHETDVVGHKLPLAEWRLWMRHCLDQADHVLCLCSQKYAELARRDDEGEPKGFGVAFEVFEMEQRLYGQKQHNKDWIWTLRLDGDPPSTVIPRFLEQRCPPYSSPSEESRLVRELVGKSALRRNSAGAEEQSSNTGAPTGSPLSDLLGEQRQLVEERLQQAPVLWSSLGADSWEGNKPAALRTEATFASWLSCASPDEAEDAMFAVRRALEQVPLVEEQRRPAELATMAVYALAACRLVDRDAPHAANRFPAPIAHAAHLYCAVVATVLFGGRLEFAPSAQPGWPRPPNAYEIRVPAAGDHRNLAFEHAVFQALFSNDPRTPEVSLETAALSTLQRARISRHILSMKRVKQQTLTLVVHVDALYPPADAFAQEFKVPVFVCDREIAGALIGMSAEALVADIQEVWEQLHLCSESGRSPTHGLRGAANPSM